MNTTNTLLIIIAVLLVGFGVWYMTSQQAAPAEDTSGGIEVRVDGFDDNAGGGESTY